MLNIKVYDRTFIHKTGDICLEGLQRENLFSKAHGSLA